ncbi:MAG: hypothetical protein WC663_00635 [Patescibacteria group bacterium]|jgi:SAM-dependent methyltransferase
MYLILALSLITLAITAIIAIITILSLLIFGYVKVPYVKTPEKGVEKMFELAKIKPNEIVYDLGCGNGQFVFKAEKDFKANASGFELSPYPFVLAKTSQIIKGYKSKIYFKNFLKEDLSDADVIFCFLMPGACKKLSQKLDQELTPKTRIVSYGFGLLNLKNFNLVEKCYNKNTPIYYYENYKTQIPNSKQITNSKIQADDNL